jgi:4-hydroxy-3-polyprenylbenzoate decarboxylase
MSYSGLSSFVSDLEKSGELHRINTFVDPVLEIAEITDRITKSHGKALLFDNNSTVFPLLINAFGSDRRMTMAIGNRTTDEISDDIRELFEMATGWKGSLPEKLYALPKLIKISGYLPSVTGRKAACQENIIRDPDLGILPVIKCWPYDGGRFITLPMVHTIHPETGKANIGMYRMQILGKKSTAMHWQRHKTGAGHFESWKKAGRIMPVTVTLGGDPVYTYCATAPLPENISEYILAGFLRKKKVKLVKCITNDLYVAADSDIVLEGYVDPAEEFVNEGPFGDHTGFYSLSDFYPVFHVTCMTHRNKAVYPATIVGIPPQEDTWFAQATENIFLAPLRFAIQPEITDLHMPVAGVAHNLVIVKINKSYPGQGIKVISSLFGAGQMMFTKYLVVVSGDVDIRNYSGLIRHILVNTRFDTDILFTRGPLDVLDHSSDWFSYGGKAGIDATEKLHEEIAVKDTYALTGQQQAAGEISSKLNVPFIKGFSTDLIDQGMGILIIKINPSEDPDSILKVRDLLASKEFKPVFRLVLAVDHTVDADDLFTVTWQVSGNSDPVRDHFNIIPDLLLIDGTIKCFRREKFPRRWPDVVCSDDTTIKRIDEKWDQLGFDDFIPSPSIKHRKLVRGASGEIIPD